jgi:putative two-component system response regulator
MNVSLGVPLPVEPAWSEPSVATAPDRAFDDEEARHARRVGRFSGLLAREMGCDDGFARLIERTAPLHDIGKLFIPDEIRLKHGTLTETEMRRMRQHAEIGFRLLASSPEAWVRQASLVALCHHERWDGAGYPGGLAGESIPLSARIVAVADCYDALRTRRTYKPAFSHGRAMGIMLEGDARLPAGAFDPRVLQAFVRAQKPLRAAYDAD